MSIPPNQFRRDHPWTRFVLLDSSAGPVPSKAKVTHSLTLSLKKSNTCRSTETSTDDVLLCLAGRVDKLVDWLHIHWEISLHTDLKKQIKRCIYSLCQLVARFTIYYFPSSLNNFQIYNFFPYLKIVGMDLPVSL